MAVRPKLVDVSYRRRAGNQMRETKSAPGVQRSAASASGRTLKQQHGSSSSHYRVIGATSSGRERMALVPAVLDALHPRSVHDEEDAAPVASVPKRSGPGARSRARSRPRCVLVLVARARPVMVPGAAVAERLPWARPTPSVKRRRSRRRTISTMIHAGGLCAEESGRNAGSMGRPDGRTSQRARRRARARVRRPRRRRPAGRKRPSFRSSSRAGRHGAGGPSPAPGRTGVPGTGQRPMRRTVSILGGSAKRPKKAERLAASAVRMTLHVLADGPALRLLRRRAPGGP